MSADVQEILGLIPARGHAPNATFIEKIQKLKGLDEAGVGEGVNSESFSQENNRCARYTDTYFFNGPTPASMRLFSFFSPSGIKLGSHGTESAALSTRPQPRPPQTHSYRVLTDLYYQNSLAAKPQIYTIKTIRDSTILISWDLFKSF